MAAAGDGVVRPKVGTAVFVTSRGHPNCVLLGVRRGSHGEFTYSPPGGHLEFGESWEACAQREVEEETGLKLKNVHFGTVINAVWKEAEKHFHYVDLILTGEVDVQYKVEPENLEPDKCEGWYWYDWNNFPPQHQLFAPLQMIRESSYSPFTLRSDPGS